MVLTKFELIDFQIGTLTLSIPIDINNIIRLVDDLIQSFIHIAPLTWIDEDVLLLIVIQIVVFSCLFDILTSALAPEFDNSSSFVKVIDRNC